MQHQQDFRGAMVNQKLWISCAAGLLGLCAMPTAWAAFGDTDTTFGTTTGVPGFTVTDLGGAEDFGQDIVTGLDDRIYTLGIQRAATTSTTIHLIVSRFSKDGALDATFGDGGKLDLGPFDAPGAAYHFEVLDSATAADRRIFIGVPSCGTDGCVVNVVSFLFDGELDPDYGTGGLARFGINEDDPVVNQLLLLPGGKLLVLTQHDTDTGTATILARLNTDGALDGTFGTAGRVDVSARACDVGPALTLGRVSPSVYVTAGTRAVCASAPVPAVTRVNLTNGTLDTTFGTGGHVVGDFGFTEDIVGLVAQEQLGGTIAYAMGNFNSAGGLDVDIITLQENGSRDTSIPAESGSYSPVAQYTLTGGAQFQTDGKAIFNGRYQTSLTNADQAITRIQGSAKLAHQPRFAVDNQPPLRFVGFADPSATVEESDGTTTVIVTLCRATTQGTCVPAPSTQGVRVPFSLGGSATNGIDYTLSTNAFVIPAGATTGSVVVTILNDDVEEFAESILFTLGQADNAQNTANGNTFILQIDDDDLRVTPAPNTGDGGALGLGLLSALLGFAGLRRRIASVTRD